MCVCEMLERVCVSVHTRAPRGVCISHTVSEWAHTCLAHCGDVSEQACGFWCLLCLLGYVSPAVAGSLCICLCVIPVSGELGSCAPSVLSRPIWVCFWKVLTPMEPQSSGCG